ncbi:carbonic anhydrase [Cohnella sp.]|uniref:carbonic anhydrase n=1 Tax=Cohnella sp. TaxID=1883426 RepID=UPI00356AEB84
MEGLFRYAVLTATVFSMLICAGCSSVNQPIIESSAIEEFSTIKPNEAIFSLREGNVRFVGGHLSEKHLLQVRQDLVSGQHPIAVIISCSDSRVTPEIVFDQTLGNLFVIRVVGNILDPDVLGSVEYAVEHLHVPLVMVMGHEQCGAVIAALQGHQNGNIRSIMKKIEPSADKVKSTGAKGEELINNTVIQNVKAVEKELKRDPIIKEQLQHGELKISGTIYRLSSGYAKLAVM